ncbi:MAG: methyltransferase RsmF C-terminal domain-like protein [Candidatus Woesearchaeota archaeon]
MAIRILKSKEAKKIISDINSHWDSSLDISPDEYVFTMNEKERIQITKKEVYSLDINNYSTGIYFGSIMAGGFRLSIEGSQLVGATAKKNILDLDFESAKRWMKGEDIDVSENRSNEFVIIRHDDDFLGSGKLKDGYILNYVPKPRRVNFF